MAKGRIRPAKYVLSGCTRGCSLNAENLPAGIGELVHKWFEDGKNNGEIIALAAPFGAKLSNGSVGRHRSAHLHAAQVAPVSAPSANPGQKLADLDVIESIIQTGAQQVGLSTSKVTTEQLLRAIELKHKLTEGSVFDAMYDAMIGSESGEDDLSDLEAESAIRSTEERDQEAVPDGRSEGR